MKRYYTSTWTTCFVFLLGATGSAIAIFGNPHGFQLNFITVFLVGIIVFGFIDMKFGTFVTLDSEVVTKTETFFFCRRALIRDIDIIRYQPSYGVGKEISSLFIFTKQNDSPVITMTSTWFTEPALRDLAQELCDKNKSIRLDEEAKQLLAKH